MHLNGAPTSPPTINYEVSKMINARFRTHVKQIDDLMQNFPKPGTTPNDLQNLHERPGDYGRFHPPWSSVKGWVTGPSGSAPR